MELLQSHAFTEACEGTHTLMYVEHRNRIGCTYIKYNLHMPKSTRKGKKPEPFWVVLFIFFVVCCVLFLFSWALCFRGLVLCLVQKIHKHTCSFLQILH